MATAGVLFGGLFDDATLERCCWLVALLSALTLSARLYMQKRKLGEVLRTLNPPVQRLSTDHWGLFERIVTHARDAVMVTESDPIDGIEPRILYVNPEFTRQTGYAPEEVLGRPPRLLHGEQTAPAAIEQLRQAVESRVPVLVELLNYRKDGSHFWVELSLVPIFNSEGRCSAFVSIQRDITERKKGQMELEASAGRLSMALKVGQIGCWERDLRTNRLYKSDQIRQIYGLSETDTIVDFPTWLEVIHPDDREPFLQTMQQTCNGAAATCEFRILRRDGQERWLLSRYARLIDPTGEDRMIGVELDITDRKSAEQDAQRALAERHELQQQFLQSQKMEAIGRLAGGVAHDFNNLLTVINGYCEILEGTTPADSPSAPLVAEIHRAGNRAADLTRQLLMFSRKQLVTRTRLNLSDVAAANNDMLGRMLGEDIELKMDLSPEIANIGADLGQIEHILLNLAANARDAMPRGGLLLIQTANVDIEKQRGKLAPGRYVCLTVRDTGVGFAPEAMQHIFEPFFTTKGVGKGAGLGLATVYGIVTQWGGHIEVNSHPGEGTTFEIFWPALPRTETVAARHPSPGTVQGGKETVLLVEDDPGVRLLAHDLLKSLGYKVLEATDPFNAIEIAKDQTQPIDVLLTDVVMPRMAGPEVAAHVRNARPSVKVVFMSGYTDDMLLRNEVDQDVTFFLDKPFTRGTLARRLREALDG